MFEGRSPAGLGVRRAVAAILLVLGLLLPNAAYASNADLPEWQAWRQSLAPLIDAKTWVLEGKKLDGGGCRYDYEWAESEVPESGYVYRSIALDSTRCLKLMEEGIPTAFEGTSATEGVAMHRQDVESEGDTSASLAVTQTRRAWQRVYWADVANFMVNATITEISWKYNGTSVLSGTVAGTSQWNTVTEWVLNSHSATYYMPNSSYYRGQMTATFSNDWFCWPLPKVWTYHYYNRVWGHPEGHATRSQSSDSVNECAPLHVGVESAYGRWPG